MAKQKVTAETLSDEIKAILESYADDVNATLKEEIKAVAKAGAQALKNDANAMFEDVHLTRGRYGSGWTSRVEETRLNTSAVIYNSKYPGLPHLLEYGHAMRGGGRVQAHPHIKPVEDQLSADIMQELKAKL